jgi:hypothetical protein
VKYVDAGYVVALSSLTLYALGLLVRRRRLERQAGRRAPERDHLVGPRVEGES